MQLESLPRRICLMNAGGLVECIRAENDANGDHGRPQHETLLAIIGLDVYPHVPNQLQQDALRTVGRARRVRDGTGRGAWVRQSAAHEEAKHKAGTEQPHHPTGDVTTIPLWFVDQGKGEVVEGQVEHPNAWVFKWVFMFMCSMWVLF